MATIRDVAREAGVSVASASRALNGHDNVTPDMRDRVRRSRGAPAQLCSPRGARSLTRRRSDAIGVVLPDLFGEYFSELVRGIDRVAHASGLQLLRQQHARQSARSRAPRSARCAAASTACW